MNGSLEHGAIKSFEEYKKLTNEEERFYIFMRLQKIDTLHEKIDGMKQIFASKWVERVVAGAVILILTSIGTAVMATVIM